MLKPSTFKHRPPVHLKSKYKYQEPINYMFTAPHSPPLPCLFLVFSSFTLYQNFVVYIMKLGKHFLGFMDSIYMIVSNIVLLARLASASSCNEVHT